MSGGLQAAAVATAAVYVGGARVGSAVLVDGRHLLTAAHVLRRQAGLAEKAEVLFPSGPAPATRLPVTQALLSADVTADLAVLDLGPEPAANLPRPVELWPAARLPERVSAFGFPRAEKDLTGWWRDFDVAGPVGRNLVQVHWAGGVGTLPGHSGGPVFAAGTNVLVGVVAEGSAHGQFDRFLPLTVVWRCWSGLHRPWLMPGTDGRGHFNRRGRGHGTSDHGGDRFCGRAAALTAVRAWLTAEVAPGRPLVITGQPGAGKSAVLARTVLDLEADGIGPGLAFHARDATHADLLRAVADLTGYDGELTGNRLRTALAEATGAPSPGWIIACDALDEAASPTDRDDIVETLTVLARLPAVRVAVATRPLGTGDRYARGAVLPRLRIRSASSMAFIDLDVDRYFDGAGLRDFAAAVLAQTGLDHPDPAAEAYRDDAVLCRRLAAVITDRAERNYLVAALTAQQLSGDDHPVDPAADGFDSRSIAGEVGEALEKYLERLPDDRRDRGTVGQDRSPRRGRGRHWAVSWENAAVAAAESRNARSGTGRCDARDP